MNFEQNNSDAVDVQTSISMNVSETIPAVCRAHVPTQMALISVYANQGGPDLTTLEFSFLLDIDECLSSPCGSRGTCSNTAGSFACSCQAGFTGQTCNVDINECLSNPCRNGATCNDLINSFSCQCAAGFSGRFCETNINECLSSPCKNGGICIDLINGFRCSCPSNWQGTTCETDVNECTNGQSRCSSNANCTNTPGSYICNCKAGYYGDGFTCKEDRLLKYTDGTKVTQRYKDFASPSINIPTEFPFGGAFYNTLYFTDNGVIIFRRNFYDPTYTMSYPYFFSNNDYYTPPMIAVFWADADFSRMGELWYKHSVALLYSLCQS
ncbi:uncharacterized protein PAF06_007093 [Gastrophryne carolinensis]